MTEGSEVAIQGAVVVLVGEERRTFVVTVRTPAGHEHRFRVNDNQRVEVLTRRAVEYFVAHGELADGRYHLALLRDGEALDLHPASRLGDYDVVEGDVLVLIVGDPQVDG